MNFLDTSRLLVGYNQNLHPLLVKMAEDDLKDGVPQPVSPPGLVSKADPQPVPSPGLVSKADPQPVPPFGLAPKASPQPAPAPDQAPEAAPQPQEPAVKVIPPELDEDQQKQLKDLLRQVGQAHQDERPQQPLAPKFVPFVASATADQPEVPVYTRREGLSPYSVSPTSAGGDNVYTFQNMQFRERPVVVQSPSVSGMPTVDSSPSEQEPYIPKWRLGQQAARERYRIENALKDINSQSETLKTGGYNDKRITAPAPQEWIARKNRELGFKLTDDIGQAENDFGLAAKQEGTAQGAGQANAEGGNQAAPGDTPQPAPGDTPQATQENKADEAKDKAKPDEDKNKDTDAPKAPSQPPAQPSGEANQVVPAEVEKWQGTTDYWTKVIENYRKGANDMFSTYMRLRSEYPAYSRRPMQLSVYGMVNMLPLVSVSDYKIMADAYIRYWNRVYGQQAQPVPAQAAQQVAPQPSAPVGAAEAATGTTPTPATGTTPTPAPAPATGTTPTPAPAPEAATGGTNQSGAQASTPAQPAAQ